LILVILLSCSLFILYNYYVKSNSHDNCISEINTVYNILKDNINHDFKNMMRGETQIHEYIKIADITSSQINYQIIWLLKSTNNCDKIVITQNDFWIQLNNYVHETMIIANIFDLN